MKLDYLRNQLETLNRELAELTHQPPVELRFQSGQADRDTLFLYGIMGGKDVGKTSLINQLAGNRISIDTDILDEGTKIAVGYCHEFDLPMLKERLSVDIGDRLYYVTHRRDQLRNVVLIDFPDFDSRFVSHREDVHTLSRHLQGIVWMITPRKYGDKEFIDRLENIAQSNQHYDIVLNKMDQLAGAAEAETIREEVFSFLQNECHKRHIKPLSSDRFFLLSIKNPQHYDFEQFHARLIRKHSLEEIMKAKVENIRAEFEKNIERIEQYYSIDEKIKQIDSVYDQLQVTINEQFPDTYAEKVWKRVQTLELVQRRISTDLFFQRVGDWPILRSLCYPLAGFVAFISRHLSGAPKSDDWSHAPRDILRDEGKTASGKLQDIHHALKQGMPESLGTIGEIPDYAQLVDQAFTRLMHHYEENVIQTITTQIKPPNAIHKFGIYFPLVWFPFLQPLTLHLIRKEENILSFSGVGDLLAQLISLLGAGALLESVLFLLVFYGIWLVLLYSKGTRRVLKVAEDEFKQSWMNDFFPWIKTTLSQPLLETRERWLELKNRLSTVNLELEKEVQHIAKT